MRELKPYRTLAGARAALDNGGRFFNLLTRADDDRISKVELTKAAGVFRSEQQAFLFLHMALADLTDGQRSEVLSLLEPPLAGRYKSHGPRRLETSAVADEAMPGELIVVEGYPRYFTESKVRSVVFIPAGKVMMPVPVEVYYDGYHVFATADATGIPASLVMKRGKQRLADRFTRFGGVIRPNAFEDGSGNKSGVFLEPLFFTALGCQA